MNEIAIVEMLRRMAARSGHSRKNPAAGASLPRASKRGSGLILGIGDDCAIFRPRPGEDFLFKTDQFVEDAHFRRDQSPALIGQRALARALSDIAAMGGDPLVCLVSLAIPPDLGENWIKSFYRGLLRIARGTGTTLGGGDLGHSEKIYCDVALCGSVPRGQALRRDGARPGDSIYVSGRLGKPWDRPIAPRLGLGRSLRGLATACMDISDGIALDLHRLCMASGVAAELDQVPIVKGATLERALHGGEDYELLFTMPAAEPRATGSAGNGAKNNVPRGCVRVGTIVRGKPGSVLFHGQPLPPRGYDHFRK